MCNVSLEIYAVENGFEIKMFLHFVPVSFK